MTYLRSVWAIDESAPYTMFTHASVEHRDRGRRGGVAVGRPGVERPDAGKDDEAHVEREEDPALERAREIGGLEIEERERAGAGVDVEREHAHQDEGRAEQKV